MCFRRLDATIIVVYAVSEPQQNSAISVQSAFRWYGSDDFTLNNVYNWFFPGKFKLINDDYYLRKLKTLKSSICKIQT